MNNDEIKETSIPDEQNMSPVEIGSSDLGFSGFNESKDSIQEAIQEAPAESEIKQANDGFSVVFKEPKRLILFIMSIAIALALIITGGVLVGASNNGMNAGNNNSGSSYKTITTDAAQTVYVNNTYQYFKFIPKTSGTYAFYTVSGNDTYGLLHDGEFVALTSDDDSGNGNNFRITRYLYSGSTYYIGVKSFNSYSFSATLYVVKE